MAINFPDSPSNGDTQTINGAVYAYNSTTGKWDVSGDNTTNVTVSDTAPSGAVAGDQWFNSTDGSLYVYYNDGSSSQWVGISGPAGSSGEAGGVTSYANKTAIDAVSSPSEGDLAYDTAADQLYIRTTTEWKRVSAGTDESPIVTTEPATTHDLNSDGTTSTITMVAEDPEGFDITYGIAYPTASNALPDQLANVTTIDQSTGVFTFDPSTNTSHAGSVKVRLSASDGVNTTTRFSTLSLGFFGGIYGVHGNLSEIKAYSGTAPTITNAVGTTATSPATDSLLTQQVISIDANSANNGVKFENLPAYSLNPINFDNRIVYAIKWDPWTTASIGVTHRDNTGIVWSWGTSGTNFTLLTSDARIPSPLLSENNWYIIAPTLYTGTTVVEARVKILGTGNSKFTVTTNGTTRYGGYTPPSLPNNNSFAVYAGNAATSLGLTGYTSRGAMNVDFGGFAMYANNWGTVDEIIDDFENQIKA